MKTKIPIQASLLLSTNKTLKDLKTEILLSFVLQLFEEYEELKEEKVIQTRKFITVKTENDKNTFIDKVVSELVSYLKENVINQKKLFKIFRQANLNQQSFLLAKQYEPYGVYYEKLGMLLKKSIPEGSLFMPEFLGFLLLYLYKTNLHKSFIGFSLIEEYKFEMVIAVYNEVNINIKKDLVQKHPNTRIWEHRTIFDTMENIAIKIVQDYDCFQYKLNTTRKSKTRKK